MKKIFYIIAFSLMQLILYSQDTIKSDIYQIVYSQALEQPLYIKYKVLCPFGKESRTGMSFWKPDSIHTSDGADYEDNIWDRGHMVPANSFNCNREMLYATFNYINSALQHRSLNRGVWSRLELFEKDLAKFYEVTVEINVIFKGPPNRLITGAFVPSGFKKTIKFDNKQIIMYFPNKDTSGSSWYDFIITD